MIKHITMAALLTLAATGCSEWRANHPNFGMKSPSEWNYDHMKYKAYYNYPSETKELPTLGRKQ